MDKQTIVTFSGKAQHGKDTAAKILQQLLEQQDKKVMSINYADYLKYLATQYLGWDGSKDEKGRTLLQQLGTEKVRYRFPDFWVDNVISLAKIFDNDCDYILIGDCRFPNEINKWGEEGYTVIPVHVERLNFDNGLTDEQKCHLSETSLDDFPFKIKLKVEEIGDLEDAIKSKLKELMC